MAYSLLYIIWKPTATALSFQDKNTACTDATHICTVHMSVRSPHTCNTAQLQRVYTFVTDVVVEKVCPGQHHAVNPDGMLDEVATAAGGVGQQLNTAKVIYQFCFQAESLKDKQTLCSTTRALRRMEEGEERKETARLVNHSPPDDQTDDVCFLDVLCGQQTAYQTDHKLVQYVPTFTFLIQLVISVSVA